MTTNGHSSTYNGNGGTVGCGHATTLCADGYICVDDADCESDICRISVCQTQSSLAHDGKKDGDETDVDCGGLHAPACADGLTCLVAEDCASVVCTGSVCQVPTHTDNVKNGDETGVDCGGPTAPKCEEGQGCESNDDCDALACDVGNTNECLPASHDDGVKNGDETGADCGGPTAPNKCPTGQGCTSDDDCDHVKCDADKTNLCLSPTSGDLIKNGNETDVDCGSSGQGVDTHASQCAIGKACGVDNDCSGAHVCNYNHKCVEAPSCRVQHGGDTCGAGETGHGENHESCCASLPLPNSTVRVDKYEITAGRVREFLRVVDNDVQDWWTTHPGNLAAGQIRSTDVQYLPTGLSSPTLASPAGGTDTFGVYNHVGEHVFRPNLPSGEQGCFISTIASNGYGHPTFWFDDATRAQQFGTTTPRAFGQNDLDEKSLNCVTQILLAAFCAWDGGRLPTTTELSSGGANSAWGGNTYPWGPTPAYSDTITTDSPGRRYATGTLGTSYYTVPMMNNDGTGTINFDAPRYNTTNWNPFYSSIPTFRYVWPAVPVDNWDQTDQAYAIAAPGRMINDKHATGPGALDGWFYLVANLMEMTAGGNGGSGNGDADWVGGSWEGHIPPVSSPHVYDTYDILTKYGKTGGRCAR